MHNFEQSRSWWQKNGIEAKITDRFLEYGKNQYNQTQKDEIGQDIAQIAYSLNLQNLFAKNISWEKVKDTEELSLLQHWLRQQSDPGRLHLFSRFCKDITQKYPINRRANERLGYFMEKMANLINENIIDEHNYRQMSRIAAKTYKYTNCYLFNRPQISCNDYKYWLDKLFNAKISNQYVNMKLQHKKDYMQRLNLLNIAMKEMQDFDKVKFLQSGMDAYLRINKSLDTDFIKGIKDNMVPEIKNGKENTKEDNLWGLCEFDYGIGDFKYKALTTKITPDNIAGLMRIYKEIPTTNFKTFMQNRNDGLSLQNVKHNSFDAENRGFEALRDTIHDQRPQTAKLIAKLVDFYNASQNINPDDPKQKAKIADLKQEIIQINRENIGYELSTAYLFDLHNYNQKVDIYGKSGQKEPVISILRRLKENMLSDVKVPKIASKTINQAAKKFETNPSDKQALAELLQEVNNKLIIDITKQKVGISPEEVALLAWIDKKCASVINDMDYEMQLGAQKNEWLKQAIKFSMLINDSGANFDEAKYKALITPTEDLSADEKYQLIANENSRYLQQAAKHCKTETGKILQKLIQGDISKLISEKYYDSGEFTLAEKYRRGERLSGKEKQILLAIIQYHNRVDNCGSGNTLKALQGLSVWHNASTKAGERHRKRRIEEQPLTDNLNKMIKRAGLDITDKTLQEPKKSKKIQESKKSEKTNASPTNLKTRHKGVIRRHAEQVKQKIKNSSSVLRKALERFRNR